MMTGQRDNILTVTDLSIGFGPSDQEAIAITDRVNFALSEGEVLGLVGESGCGKSVTALAVLRLLPHPEGRVLNGQVLFRGQDVLSMSPNALRELRGNGISMIFQEPSSALNPLLSVRRQLYEVFEFHEHNMDPDVRVNELMGRVGFPDPERVLDAYPHQLSGGMLQRVMIAMALLLKPDLIIADEPTTALDVTVQAQIMELLVQLTREEGAAVLLITHNLGLIAQYATRLAVMYAGRIVESAMVEAFLKEPLHPYAKGLMAALPDLSRSMRERLLPIDGQVPRPQDYPSGCRFRPRCKQAFAPCENEPTLKPKAGGDLEHRVACFLHDPGASASEEAS